MMENLPSLRRLLRQFQQVPYLASKNLYRVTDYFLRLPVEQVEQFCAELLKARQHIVPCPLCYAWKETDEECSFCSSSRRDSRIICVVSTWHDLLALEKTGGYKGVYHVLGGLICPLEGIGPENLTINGLVARAKEANEIILALSQTPEGEATASFIAHQLRKSNILISCLARGVPIGSSLESLDRLTIYKALSERRPF